MVRPTPKYTSNLEDIKKMLQDAGVLDPNSPRDEAEFARVCERLSKEAAAKHPHQKPFNSWYTDANVWKHFTGAPNLYDFPYFSPPQYSEGKIKAVLRRRVSGAAYNRPKGSRKMGEGSAELRRRAVSQLHDSRLKPVGDVAPSAGIPHHPLVSTLPRRPNIGHHLRHRSPLVPVEESQEQTASRARDYSGDIYLDPRSSLQPPPSLLSPKKKKMKVSPRHGGTVQDWRRRNGAEDRVRRLLASAREARVCKRGTGRKPSFWERELRGLRRCGWEDCSCFYCR